MSRGLGRVQRALLVALNDHDSLTAAELAVVVYNRERRGVGSGWWRTWMLSDAKLSAVRRALADRTSRASARLRAARPAPAGGEAECAEDRDRRPAGASP
jgi:hypothetical protein